MQWKHSLVLAVLLLGAVTPAAAEISITEFDVPKDATWGDQVTVSITAEATEQQNNEIEVIVIRMDTEEVICTGTGPMPGTASCSAAFPMPRHDVHLEARLRLVTGSLLGEDSATIDAESPPEGEGSTTPISDTDGQSTIGTVIDDITEAGSTALADSVATAIIDVLIGILFPFVKNLVSMVAVIVMWVPDVHPNPAVEDVHSRTLRVAILLSLCGFMVAGILFQIGPILNVSYQEARLILPRLIAALLFATVSLPVLQLSIDLANAMTQAFQPELLDASLGSVVSSMSAGAALLVAAAIKASLLVAVLVVYLLRDVYILFVAAISPLIAVAWAVPRARRYAGAFISGWWTALAMGPLGILVLRFSFTLMELKGDTPLQAVSNWVYGLAGFALLLLIPWQLYGASQMLTFQSFRLLGQAERGTRKRYRTYRQYRENRNRREALTALRQEQRQEYGHRQGREVDANPPATEPAIRDQEWNRPMNRESWNMDERAPDYRLERRTRPDPNRENRYADIMSQNDENGHEDDENGRGTGEQ